MFDSLEQAVAYVEWQDVDDGMNSGYDSDGRLVEFGTEPIPKRRWNLFLGKRVVASIEPEPAHAEELRLTLARILAMPEASSLDELKRAALARFGLT